MGESSELVARLGRVLWVGWQRYGEVETWNAEHLLGVLKCEPDLRAALLRELGAVQVTDRPDASAPPGRVWSGEVPLNEGDWIVPAQQPEEAK